MGKNWKSLFSGLQIVFIALLLSSCSVPRVIVYEDPLTAKQHNDLGVLYERKGMLELAQKEYEKAIKKDPDWYLPYFNLGNLFFKKKMYNKAIKLYKQSLEKNPENADALNNIAYVYYVIGDYQKAYFYVKRALSKKLKPEYLDTMERVEEKIYESD